ncbi:hypothetical protein [Brevundimonas sp.]|uniref:hypothetical protein n=1 Tax=Brevundimonas sp. TaxID=1871086 RepID=UPI003D6D4207
MGDFQGPAFAARCSGVIAAALLLVQCDRPDAIETPEAPSVAAPAPTPEKTVVVVPPAQRAALSRSDILVAAEAAASAYASGQPQAGEGLVGRRFSVRLPFGCGGPVALDALGSADGLARWSWSKDHLAARLSMTPADWTASPLIASIGAEAAWEAVEGFWLSRPWMTTDACPQVASDPLATSENRVSPQTVGLAAVFERGGSRIGRRSGRAYAFTRRFEAGQAPAPPVDGYRLRLEGRVGAFPGGRAVRCHADGPDQRPTCVLAVVLDRVAYEDVAGGLLSEWRPG